ncbi:bidirectional sugar transporter N3-like [Hevea brasiliensis]|uniref:bidirectional sugar transporter N3-like n=1 Tax=Hevea brasiliensis TaxID=3981 RepID=UPI000B780C75|nr:bidirectional sugar transporter N3-like [Hevea brasiliensis]
MALHDPRLVLVFGLLGNVLSFLVYLAPLPTFYKIFKKKSTQEFQSLPYSVALFSAMLMLYYASLKPHAFMLITINSLGCVIETIYLVIYIIYAAKNSRIYTLKLLISFNLVAYAMIIGLTSLFSHGFEKMNVVGWISVVFSVSVYAAPLSIMRLVVKTKSVEYMPFSLSLALTICATCWLGYGLAVDDYFIATPNVLGFLLGLVQMILYLIYKNRKNEILPKTNSQELAISEHQTRKDGNSNKTSLNQPEEAARDGERIANKAVESTELEV